MAHAQPCEPIRAVLFDADGVVVHPWRFANLLAREHSITREMTAPFFQGDFLRCLRGELPLRSALARHLPGWGWRGDPDSFIETWMGADDAPDRDVLSEVEALRQRGVLCALASNQEQIRAEYMRASMRFGEIFDRLFFSCELGVAKPEAGFFEKVRRGLGILPAAILFIDDAQANVDAARAAGWQAQLYQDPHSLANLVANLRI